MRVALAGAILIQISFFELALLSISSTGDKWIEKFQHLKRSYLGGGNLEDWEFKGRHIWQGVASFKNFPRKFRLRAFKKVSETMSQLRCHIFAVQVNKKKLRENIENIKD